MYFVAALPTKNWVSPYIKEKQILNIKYYIDTNTKARNIQNYYISSTAFKNKLILQGKNHMSENSG